MRVVMKQYECDQLTAAIDSISPRQRFALLGQFQFPGNLSSIVEQQEKQLQAHYKCLQWAKCSVMVFALALFLVMVGCTRMPEQPPKSPNLHVIHISVDGLHADAINALGLKLAPNFSRLCNEEGASTYNARTDPAIANTLPNHVSQLTGRGVFGDDGHGWFINDDINELVTLHLFKRSYVASVFDVVHDAALSTALYANKRKFSVFDRSWNELHGAFDRTGFNNGRDKIDTYFFHDNMDRVVTTFLSDMESSNYNYVLLHLREPDSTGHDATWDLTPGSDYLNALIHVDNLLGDILKLVTVDPDLAGTTTIILTSDHGGELRRTFHVLIAKEGLIDSGIIPFCVWGRGVSAGADLYALNRSTRRDPNRSIPPLSDSIQPIRNGDAANLALDLLRLPSVPGSTINAAKDLATSKTEP